MAVRVLREILRHQPERFKDYAELTILKVLEAHKVRPIQNSKFVHTDCEFACGCGGWNINVYFHMPMESQQKIPH